MNIRYYFIVIVMLFVVSCGHDDEKAVENKPAPAPVTIPENHPPSLPASTEKVVKIENGPAAATAPKSIENPDKKLDIQTIDSYITKSTGMNQVTLGIINNSDKDIVALSGSVTFLGDLDEVLSKMDIKFDSHSSIGGPNGNTGYLFKAGTKLYFTTFLFDNGHVDVFIEPTPASVILFYAASRSKHPEVKDADLLEASKIDRRLRLSVDAVKFK